MPTIPPSPVPPWYRRGAGNYTYVAFADGTDGSGFTTDYSSAAAYIGIITSDYPIETLTSDAFIGKWITRGGAGGLSGAVAPEGNVIANVGTTYLKTETAPGAGDEQFWVKATGVSSTGWVQIY